MSHKTIKSCTISSDGVAVLNSGTSDLNISPAAGVARDTSILPKGQSVKFPTGTFTLKEPTSGDVVATVNFSNGTAKITSGATESAAGPLSFSVNLTA
ncbi:hypothetical protein DFH08DRAFT_953403 [Mycena albidolilacea]|uniref:Uncharacterized protein n=1 Tax=Mycena albidolilacea TaxID=1033008 RepID=A0AAD7AGT1_9AGAR|nr:hypothetical protein DFH08DRAFT_953403 [Mycena albidolilacea]